MSLPVSVSATRVTLSRATARDRDLTRGPPSVLWRRRAAGPDFIERDAPGQHRSEFRRPRSFHLLTENSQVLHALRPISTARYPDHSRQSPGTLL